MTQAYAKEVVRGEVPDCSRQEIAKAWQKLVDTGCVWSMGKYYSDMACALIATGVVERNAA